MDRYQCQMAKQTMGTPYHSFTHRVDNKVGVVLCRVRCLSWPECPHPNALSAQAYRIQTPQAAIVQTEAQSVR